MAVACRMLPAFLSLATSTVSCLFFFQAEDGIRDYKVTGVQTCALPISPGCARSRRLGTRHPDAGALPRPARRRPAGAEADGVRARDRAAATRPGHQDPGDRKSVV